MARLWKKFKYSFFWTLFTANDKQELVHPAVLEQCLQELHTRILQGMAISVHKIDFARRMQHFSYKIFFRNFDDVR